jgi:hypothetical protein
LSCDCHHAVADEALTKGRVCAFKPTVMYILYNAAM